MKLATPTDYNSLNITMVVFSYIPDISGTSVMVHNMAKDLVERGHSVTILTSNTMNFRPTNMDKEEIIDGVKIVRFKSLPLFPYRYLYFTPALIRKIFHTDCDVLHIYSHLPTFLTVFSTIAGKLAGKNLILTPIYHPERNVVYSGTFQKILGKMYDGIIGPLILKLTNHITALTRTEKQYYDNLGIENTYLVPDGLPLQDSLGVSPSEEQLVNFASRFNVDESKLIISVGRVEKRKGYEILIAAFKKVYETHKNVKLLIIGKDWGAMEELEDLVRSTDMSERIIFTGLISKTDLDCAYKTCTMVVHPARFETICRIALEAWLHFKPLVVFDKFADPADEHNSIITKYLDPDDLSDGIKKLLDDDELASNLGCKGHDTLKNDYDWKDIVTTMESIYFKSVN